MPLKVNMRKARDIHLAEIRKVRDAELAKRDVPFMRALESGDVDEQLRIASEKQLLRDIPADFDLTTATTPERLLARWPEILPARTD